MALTLYITYIFLGGGSWWWLHSLRKQFCAQEGMMRKHLSNIFIDSSNTR